MAADISAINETDLAVSWVTKNPYKKNTIQEQHAVISLETSHPDPTAFHGQKCLMEGRMESVDHMRGWVCTGINLC
jgi:hypothetical protein